MLELIREYERLASPLVALLLLLLGLVVGSFSSVILARVPAGQSIVSPRSRCPHCHTALGPSDLVPLLSYIWLRGRCRFCSWPIPRQYPLLEAAAGLVTGTAGLLGGWTAGAAALAAWVACAGALSVYRRFRAVRDQSGFTLVEVLVALLLLVLTTSSVFDTITFSRRSALAAQRRTAAVGLAREGFAQAYQEAAQAVQDGRPPQNLTLPSGNYVVTVTFHAKSATSWWAVVTVSCPSCKASGPTSGADVSLSGVVSP